MAHDVFISYSSRDKPIADAICANIEASGVRCWIAPRDIAPGEDWPTAITKAISQSRVMVLIFSANSNASEDVGREIMLAANNKLIIIPFKIDDVDPVPGKQYYLARTHWLDAINPPTQAQIIALVERVNMLVSARESHPCPTASQPAGKIRPSGTRLLWIPVTLILLVVVAWLGLQYGSPAASSPTAPQPTLAEAGSPTAAVVPSMQPSATPMTVVPPGTPVPGNWNVSVSDGFSSNLNNWPSVKDVNDNCSITNLGVKAGVLLWSMHTIDFNGCWYVYYPGFSSVSDFDVSLDLQSLAGEAEVGLASDSGYADADNHYSFVIIDKAQSYRVRLRYGGVASTLIGWKYDPAIKLSGDNHIAVSARGPALYFYINDKLVDTFADATMLSGRVGIIAESYSTGDISASYDNIALHGTR